MHLFATTLEEWRYVAVATASNLSSSRSTTRQPSCCTAPVYGRKSVIERGARADFRLDPYLPAVAIDNALTDGETDARTRNSPAVQPLEHAKNLLVILRRDPDAVILHGDTPQAILPFRGYMNERRAIAPVLDAIADQILEELHEMRLVAENGGQRVTANGRPGFLDRDPAVFEHRLEYAIKIDRRNTLLTVAGQLGICQQVRQQFAHTLRSVADEFDAGRGFAVELAAIAFQQEL